MDPQSIKDKKGNLVPYGPERFRQIVQERYIISKMINTSYNDVGEITPLERKYIMEFLIEEQKQKEQILKDKLKDVEQPKRK